MKRSWLCVDQLSQFVWVMYPPTHILGCAHAQPPRSLSHPQNCEYPSRRECAIVTQPSSCSRNNALRLHNHKDKHTESYEYALIQTFHRIIHPFGHSLPHLPQGGSVAQASRALLATRGRELLHACVRAAVMGLRVYGWRVCMCWCADMCSMGVNKT